MISRLRSRVAVPVLLTVFTAAPAFPQTPDSDALRLRALLFQRDYEGAVMEGARLIAEHPNRHDLRAWYLISLSRADRADEAVVEAEKMTVEAPADGWAWFALGGALNYQGSKRAEAVDAAAKALERLPGNPDAMWLRAQTLANDPKRREEAIAFVDRHRGAVANAAELVNTKAYALYLSSSPPSGGARDEAKLKAALDAFAEARKLDPSNVNAHVLAASYLQAAKRHEEAYPLIEKAVELVPASRDVHYMYWSTVRALPGLSPEQKNAKIEADLAAFLKHDDRPSVLLGASYAARDLKQPERQRDFEERILKEHNDSREAEWVLIERMREKGRTEAGAKSAEYQTMLRDYVGRKTHYHIGLLGETYRNLFFSLINSEAPAPGELLRVFDQMVKYETKNIHITLVAAPIALADKKLHLARAEEVARTALTELPKGVERDRSFYKSEREFKEAMGRAPARGHDALGWVLFAEGKIDEAEKELLAAYHLSPDSRENLHHLGRLYETRGDISRAEEYYVKGMTVQAPGTNAPAAALRSLYEKRHGSSDGYDAYLEGIRERDRVARKEKVVNARIATPERVTGFGLKTIDGRRVALDSLKGKVVVVNFWGIWCGWCVREMPDFQKLHEKYADDPNVAILTINNDSSPDDVPPWMKEKQYSFTVLLDDGYVDKVAVHTFPTTWFLDADGRKVFEKVGWSEKLLEEFSWRIEALRPTGTASR